MTLKSYTFYLHQKQKYFQVAKSLCFAKKKRFSQENSLYMQFNRIIGTQTVYRKHNKGLSLDSLKFDKNRF